MALNSSADPLFFVKMSVRRGCLRLLDPHRGPASAVHGKKVELRGDRPIAFRGGAQKTGGKGLVSCAERKHEGMGFLPGPPNRNCESPIQRSGDRRPRWWKAHPNDRCELRGQPTQARCPAFRARCREAFPFDAVGTDHRSELRLIGPDRKPKRCSGLSHRIVRNGARWFSVLSGDFHPEFKLRARVELAPELHIVVRIRVDQDAGLLRSPLRCESHSHGAGGHRRAANSRDA
jgi:hypothetical protein